MKKNILIFGHGYATQFIDISNQYTKLFNKDNYSVTIAYLVGKPDETVRKQHLADQVIFINSPKSSTRGLKLHAIKKMMQLQRENNYQIVVCHRYKPTYIMLWVSLFQKIPVLISVMHELGTLKSISRRLLIAALAKQNTYFAGVSNAVRDDIRKSIWNVPAERVITLYNMIDIELTEPELLPHETALHELNTHITHSHNISNNDPLGLKTSGQDKPFIFGTIGRLAINKDQKTLINAFAQIKSHCPNAKLIILGDGQLESELKIQVESLKLANDVFFTGFVVSGFRFMKAFDVYISSSIQEAFGRVLLEAMVSKVAIIATRVNGVPEVVGDAGILIDAANQQQLADQMLTQYNATPSQREQLGMKGYHRAVNEFSLQKFNDIFWNLDAIKKVNV